MSGIIIQSKKTLQDFQGTNYRLNVVEHELNHNLGARVEALLNEDYIRRTLDAFLSTDDELRVALSDALTARTNLHASVKSKFNQLIDVLYEGLDITGVERHELTMPEFNEGVAVDGGDGSGGNGGQTGGGNGGNGPVEEPASTPLSLELSSIDLVDGLDGNSAIQHVVGKSLVWDVSSSNSYITPHDNIALSYSLVSGEGFRFEEYKIHITEDNGSNITHIAIIRDSDVSNMVVGTPHNLDGDYMGNSYRTPMVSVVASQKA